MHPDQAVTALYRLYDSDERLLYIGITQNPKKRWKGHAATKEWWPQVARKEVGWLHSRSEAEFAEERAIVAESPVYNNRHAQTPDQTIALRELREVRNLDQAARDAKKRADEATDEAVVAAFGAGLRIGQIATELDLSESKIRIIRDKHGIAPDPRYAHLRPPARTEQESTP